MIIGSVVIDYISESVTNDHYYYLKLQAKIIPFEVTSYNSKDLKYKYIKKRIVKLTNYKDRLLNEIGTKYTYFYIRNPLRVRYN